MRAIDVEKWVIDLADRVREGKHAEDSRVELKASWPPADEKTARTLAGLANAARGEPILLVVGLDERGQKLQSADRQELANWLPQLKKHFNGLSPDLQRDLNVPVGDDTLVALLFDTSRAPYVVTVTTGGPVDRDVPWREGRRTRSATREDLLRILVPVSRRPRIEVLSARLDPSRADEWVGVGPRRRTEVVLSLDLFVTPMGGPLCFPNHRVTCRVRSPEVELPLTRCRFSSVGGSVAASPNELTVITPGWASLAIEGSEGPDNGEALLHAEISYVVTLQTSDDDQHDVTLTGTLRKQVAQEHDGSEVVWWRDR